RHARGPALSTISDPTPTDDSGTGGTGAVTARIISIIANAGLSIDDPAIVIFYKVTGVPDSISAFFVPVSDNSPDAQEIGERQSLAQNLPASGVDVFFQFFPTGAGVGFFRVGIEVTTDAQVIEAFSDGVIQVQGRPDPCFTQPCDPATSGQTLNGCGGLVCDRFHDVTVGNQDGVNIAFDAGDPEGAVKWRLFYLRETDSTGNPADQLGVEILTGSGNLGIVAFVTLELALGDYELGLSATDSGMSVAETVAFDGNDDRIVTVFGPVVRVVP
ncbi:MAG: hypothetical protein IH989_06465, partial [Planctomycetes bacterium]|nr:hypothetical protein [Planctomycetota bacterium]